MPLDHELDPISWPLLLAKWTQIAQAAVALPDAGEGGAWKASVPHIISLHAVTLALGEVDLLPDEDRPLALDRAEISCREAAAGVHEAWNGLELPEGLTELLEDARIAFEAAANAGVEWIITADRLVGDHPADVVEQLRRVGFAGELFLPQPGVPMFRGAPAAFARGPAGAAPSDEQCKLIERFLGRSGGQIGEAERIAAPRQVYRQMDFGLGLGLGGVSAPGSSGPTKDLVVPMNEPLPPGQPLLVLAIEGGEACAVPLPPRYVEDLPMLPVEIVEPEPPIGSGEPADPN